MKINRILGINRSIGRKMKWSFVLIILINALFGLYTYLTLSHSIKVLNEVTEKIDPTVEKINDFVNLIIFSKSYTTNWVYVPKYEKDKKKLIEIHTDEFPRLKKDLIQRLDTVNNDSIDSSLLSSIIHFEKILSDQETIMKALNTNAAYSEMVNLFVCKDLLEASIIPNSGKLVEEVEQLLELKIAQSKSIRSSMKDSFGLLNLMILILGVLGTSIAIIISNILAKNITRPLRILRDKIYEISKGVIADSLKIKNRDEIGEMSRSINTLIDSFKSAS
ncbi:MAG: HAMP domain-containing protein, partial [Bacteroidota bacterium]